MCHGCKLYVNLKLRINSRVASSQLQAATFYVSFFGGKLFWGPRIYHMTEIGASNVPPLDRTLPPPSQ